MSERPNVDEHVDALIGNATNLIAGTGDRDRAVRDLDIAIGRLLNARYAIPVLKSLEIDQGDLTIDVADENVVLSVTSFEHGQTGAQVYDSVIWTSSDELVAVAGSGILAGIGAGTATITATSALEPSFSASIEVTVTAL